MSKKTVLHAVDGAEDESVGLPISVGNPLSAADLAIDQSHMEDFTSVEDGPAEVACGRPPKGLFFTVFPETGTPWKNRRFYFMMEVTGRDPFLVHPTIAKQKKAEGEDCIRPVLIVRIVTMDGKESLWPIKLDPPDGKSNAFNRSAMKALKAAEDDGKGKGDGQWIRLFTGSGSYSHSVSPTTYEKKKPQMSSRTYDEMINSAFPAEQIVLDGDHQIWIDLAKGSEK